MLKTKRLSHVFSASFLCKDTSILVFLHKIYYELLLIKTMNDGLLLALGLFIGAVLVIWLVFKLYKKYDTAKSLMLMYIMHKHGPNSIVTIDLLKDIVSKALAKEGIIVSDISMVHEMGNRFHAILTIGSETREMTVIADNAGTVHYQLLDHSQV